MAQEASIQESSPFLAKHSREKVDVDMLALGNLNKILASRKPSQIAKLDRKQNTSNIPVTASVRFSLPFSASDSSCKISHKAEVGGERSYEKPWA